MTGKIFNVCRQRIDALGCARFGCDKQDDDQYLANNFSQFLVFFDQANDAWAAPLKRSASQSGITIHILKLILIVTPKKYFRRMTQIAR